MSQPVRVRSFASWLTPAGLAVLLLAGAAAAEKAQPASTLVQEGAFGAPVTFTARFAPQDADEVAFEPKQYTKGRLEITEAFAGGPVKTGDVLVRFDPQWIDREIASGEVALALAETSHKQAEVAHAQRMDELQIKREETERAHRIAQQRLERFERIERKMRTEEAEASLQRGRDGLADQLEELAQLEKMYQEDDLTEETEEIVLRRTRRQIARSKRSLAFREQRHTWFLEETLPREHEALQLALRKEVLKLERLTKTLALKKTEADLGREKAALDLGDRKRRLSELREDRKQMVLKAARDGVAVPGRVEGGAWTGLRGGEAPYEVGDRAKAQQVLYTVFAPTSLRLEGTVGQAHLDDVLPGRPVWLKTSLADGAWFQAQIERVAPFAAGDKYAVAVRLREGDPRFRVGASAKVTVLGATAGTALHVPSTALVRAKKRTYVLRFGDEGVEERDVKTGDVVGPRIAITEGLAAGDRIVENPPKPEPEPEEKEADDAEDAEQAKAPKAGKAAK